MVCEYVRRCSQPYRHVHGERGGIYVTASMISILVCSMYKVRAHAWGHGISRPAGLAAIIHEMQIRPRTSVLSLNQGHTGGEERRKTAAEAAGVSE